MAYTPENRMKLRIEADGARMTSVYDGDGLRRVRANADGVATFIWDGSDYLAEQN
jgi:YD repeat-containing protein